MEVKTETRRISMNELKRRLSAEQISKLESDGKINDDGYSITISSGSVDDNAEKGFYAEANMIILNKTGLHMRPLAVFVQTVSRFKSKVTVSARGKTSDATRFLDLICMGLNRGTEITLRAEGSDAYDAVVELVKTIEEKLFEYDH